ncbi:hypothetical protein ACSVDA_21340 [Cytobacillus sp. Hm23]
MCRYKKEGVKIRQLVEEIEFIEGVVRAILVCDTTQDHWLLEHKKEFHYVATSNKSIIKELVNKSDYVPVCIIDSTIIADLNSYGKSSMLTIDWCLERVKFLLQTGKKLSKQVYNY